MAIIDLTRLIEDLRAEFNGANASTIPGRPGQVPGDQAEQASEVNRISRPSRNSRSENEHCGSGVQNSNEQSRKPSYGSPATSSSFKQPGILGIPGNLAENSVETGSSLFPVGSVGSGRPGTGWDPALPALNLSYEALQLLVDIVRSDVEHEIRAFAQNGRTGPDAQRAAIAIARAKLRNSPVLVSHQTGSRHCLVCGGIEEADLPFIAVLSAEPGRPNWLHAACHGEHRQRLTNTVDAVLAAAGLKS